MLASSYHITMARSPNEPYNDRRSHPILNGKRLEDARWSKAAKRYELQWLKRIIIYAILGGFGLSANQLVVGPCLSDFSVALLY